MIKEYKDLEPTSKEKYAYWVDKAYKCGYTLYELRDMDNAEFKRVLGSKAKAVTIEGYKRNINQIINKPKDTVEKEIYKERKLKTVEMVKERYEKLGFRDKRLKDINSELLKVSGSFFIGIRNDVQRAHNLSEAEADQYTKELLLVPKNQRGGLDPLDQAILEDFSP